MCRTMNLIKEAIYEAQNWWTACTWTEKNIPNLEGKTILVTGNRCSFRP